MSAFWSNLIGALIGVLIGGLTTYFVARYYYKRASQELKDEATELRDLTTLVLRGLERAGFVEYSKDEQGKPVGIIFRYVAKGALGSLSSTAEAKLIKSEDSDP